MDNCRDLKIEGHDVVSQGEFSLICASVTAIITGAWNACDNLYTQDVSLRAEKGYASLKIKKNTQHLQTIIKVIYYQLLTLSQQYSKYIKIYIGGHEHEV